MPRITMMAVPAPDESLVVVVVVLLVVVGGGLGGRVMGRALLTPISWGDLPNLILKASSPTGSALKTILALSSQKTSLFKTVFADNRPRLKEYDLPLL